MSEKTSKPIHGFFVTGSDTGIGKTYVCRLLIQTFMKSVSVSYLKPVQTGCYSNENGDLIAPDFEFIRQGGILGNSPYELHVPYRFKPACSPHLAAKLDNSEILFPVINQCLETLQTNSKLVIVEGAGGVYVPLKNDVFMMDLIAFLNMPVILVVSPKLGTLNHALLSINALRERSLRLAGVVMNDSAGVAHDFIYNDNSEFIRETVWPAAFINVPFNAGQPPRFEEFCRELLR
jgi:dethiobiotin synthase